VRPPKTAQSNRVSKLEIPKESEKPPRRALRNRNPDAAVYHAAYEVSAKWPTALCIELDVIAQGTSREAAMDNLEAAIEVYLGVPENSVRVEPAVSLGKKSI
jgi:predicted RNase H-like HicB family nuclease